jgi:translation initiation factor 2 alpha subunit (eIF-2alpha)
MSQEIKKTIKIQINQSIFEKIDSAIEIIKSRGGSVTHQDFLGDYLDQISDRYINKKTESLTPPTYYLEIAKNNPELLKSLVSKAKRALSKPIKQNKRIRKDVQNDSELCV